MLPVEGFLQKKCGENRSSKRKNPTEFTWVGFLYMAHSGGFEPPTARFVAEYSIQLSYECVVTRRVY